MRKFAVVPIAAVMIAAAFRVTPSAAPVADLNDNRISAGTLKDGVLSIDLEATLAAWKPDKNVDSLLTIQTFAERGKTPSVPGPLIRAPLGTEIRVRLHNALADSTLTVHGFRPDDPANDTINVAPWAGSKHHVQAHRSRYVSVLGNHKARCIHSPAVGSRDSAQWRDRNRSGWRANQ